MLQETHENSEILKKGLRPEIFGAPQIPEIGESAEITKSREEIEEINEGKGASRNTEIQPAKPESVNVKAEVADFETAKNSKRKNLLNDFFEGKTSFEDVHVNEENIAGFTDELMNKEKAS
jgi:hypothetical protein